MSRTDLSKSIQFLGFDRRNEQYTLVGLDTMGTYFVTARGTFDEELGAIVMSGVDEDPFMTQEYDFVMKTLSDDEYTVELYFRGDMAAEHGVERFKMMELRSKRRE